MNDRLKTLLAHASSEQRVELKRAIEELGHEVVCDCDSCEALVSTVRSSPPDLIVTGVDLTDGDGIQALVSLADEFAIPAIVVTTRTSLQAVERAILDHVMAYLIEPVEVREVKPTIHLVLKRFEQFQELQSEVESLRGALEDRKVIERAKGVMMKADQLDEDTAYKKLRRMATDRRIRLIDAAKAYLEEETKGA
ncbi:putative transcriptional regulatory protein pdtaR [Caulifigura coniformis]|uniref:Putative transcriptional regulatory protein pdtaR n=1 Tax=Caulifigura coniformis TaxID=2527983 RepID=A0A517SFD4_9PLAN|nr:ANTAR domain-containing protein [Caulifigura coniformis]QDT54845.1 putative transcriptional regulatory protein pdtaR [Caulifigura coniformis]